MDYPEATKGDVVDDYHGTSVSDPYRWLEDPDSPETKAWVAKENSLTEDFLLRVPEREKIKTRIKDLWNYVKRGTPHKEGTRYFSRRNDGLQNQSVFYVQESLDSKPEVLLDPNSWSSEGTTAIGVSSASKDAKYLAYAVQEKGSDWQTVKVINIDTKEILGDEIKWCKFTDFAWAPDGSGFYYGRYPKPDGSLNESENSHNRIYFHKLGTKQEDDVLLHEDPDDKDRHFGLEVTEDGEYLVLESLKGTGSLNKVHYRRFEDEKFLPIFDAEDAQYLYLDNIGTTFYFQTDKDAPMHKIVSVDVNDITNVRDVIAEGTDALSFSRLINDKIVVGYLHDAHHILKIFNLDGSLYHEVPLPAMGTIGGLSGKREHNEMFFSLGSFLLPTTIYRYDFESKELKVIFRPEVKFDTSKYETKQVFFTSKDGTKVPMFITSKKDIDLDGSHPTLLHGYGGFNISVLPRYSITVAAWLDMGGIYADANLRGGSEYGSKWHEAGMLQNKQNVFDDFIAASEYLIDKKYTSSKKLAIIGGSNGGLLVAACMTQRPELFGGVVCQVPVADMLRYHRFTIGKYWTPEFGNAEKNASHFDFMYKYSPLHNVHKVSYPPILIWTADHDDRVVSSHAKKFAATLQENDTGNNPLLLHIETSAGHGAGKPTLKVIQEKADIYSFLYKVLDM